MNMMPKSTKAEDPAGAREAILRSLAIELARDIHEAEDILARYGLSADEYALLAQDRAFKAMLASAAKEWGAAVNTSERVKVKSAALIEEALPRMFSELTNDQHPLSSRADLFGRIAKMGGLGEAKQEPNKGEVFSISINIGANAPVTAQVPLSRVIEGDFEELNG